MSLPHSGQRISSRSVRNPRPTRETEHFLQLKQSLCHWRSSKEMYLLPPRPKGKRTSPDIQTTLLLSGGPINWWILITANGSGAGGTLLGIEVAEAVEAIGKVISWGKPLARQLLLAASTQEAVLVPRLVMVGHAASSDGLIREQELPIVTLFSMLVL